MILGTSQNKDLELNPDSLKKHFIALGGSGSGKTVLCKVIIEEASKIGIKSIIIDTQGDLASLAINKENIKANVVIYTPTSSKGIPLCLNPLKLPSSNLPEEELISILNSISTSVCKLLGYNVEKDAGKNAVAFLYEILRHNDIQDFEHLISITESTEDSQFLSKSELSTFIKKLKLLTVGEKKLLFNFGVSLDIKDLLAKADISVIYLNTLNSQDDKDFLVSVIAKELYQWMLSNPSDKLKTLFYIDEISSYVPAGTKQTSSKNILNLLFKQARKYGLGCIISTQNPGDIDYKAFAQFGTWGIGRLTVKQDREKIKAALKSLTGDLDFIEKLPKLKPGNFLLFSPDNYDTIKDLNVRWLLTEHKTLTPQQVQKLMDPLRDNFKIESKTKSTQSNKSAVVEQSKERHLPLNIDESQVTKLIEKNKKKLFKFFGPEQEKLDSFKLKYLPFHKTLIRVKEKKYLGLSKELNDYEIYFSAIDSSLYQFKDTSFKKYLGFNTLLPLSESEILTLKALIAKDKVTLNELAYNLGKSTASVNSSLKTLLDKKLITYDKKGSSNIWSLLTKINIPNKLSSLHSTVSLSSKKHDALILKPKISTTDLGKTIRTFFGTAELISSELVYYPVYEIKYISKKASRTLTISAVNGSEFE